MTQRFESAVPVASRYSDPNYPGALPEEPPVAARTTSRATVTYESYVLQYAARQRGHVLLLTAGIVLIIGAVIYLNGAALVFAVAMGLGAGMSGIVGFAVAADAHASYTRDLAVSVSETYHPRPAAPPPATVRPFVATSNGTGRTTNTGRLDFAPQVWQSLFDQALGNGGAITRDGAKDARIGREWYHGDGYGRLLEELTRLGFIDARNRLTPAALAWYEAQIPLPLSALPVRSRIERTNGERTGANGAIFTE